uniref:Uncharacterized protein n=1 Tax=Anolis carolinensis TaxID=28377 RepID=A0A803TR17_ANOCA
MRVMLLETIKGQSCVVHYTAWANFSPQLPQFLLAGKLSGISGS